MNDKEVTASLKERAKSDPVWSAVAHIFALRERARSEITLFSLTRTMAKEGFNHPKAAYASILEFLAKLGLGVLEKDYKGKVRGLKNIKITLQSIGLAAIGSAQSLDAYRQKTRYQTLPIVKLEEARYDVPKPPLPTVTERRAPRQPRPYQTPRAKIILTVLLGNDKPVNIPVPADFSPDEVAELIGKFNDRPQKGEREA